MPVKLCLLQSNLKPNKKTFLLIMAMIEAEFYIAVEEVGKEVG